jgi:hypothetical protein
VGEPADSPGDDLRALGRLVDALRPWLGHLVIVGGWAHRLHRLHPDASPPPYRALRTRDADLAFSARAPLTGDMGAALAAAGFREEFSSEHTPPVSRYHLGTEDQGFYAEFLAPLEGSSIKRSGAPDATVARAGVTAQKLRHVDLLLMRPWVVTLGSSAGVPVSARTDVRLANPVLFVAQKLLIARYRNPDKQAQDILYIHDTLDLFARSLDALRAEWRDHVRPTLLPRRAREIEQLARDRFATVSDVLRAAARIPSDRTLLPERLRAACAVGLDAVFGAP